ncbi:MAG: glycoside hydrolase family 3 C-terminal domain-containing protein [Clostridia bacterium]|nr:glycoside hydrolase family 3 C-terminal domain-containing protein [Clostridia bacterium]
MEKYKDKSLPVNERIADLISRMTLEEKARQIDQYSPSDFCMQDKETGELKVDYEKLKLMGNNAYGNAGLGRSSAKLYNEIQRYVIENTRLGIPVLFCSEALHGYCRVGATVFPQQIALGCTFDPSLGEEMGEAIAREERACGVQETWNPVCDLAREPRWGRTEENFGEDTYLSSRFAYHIVRGLQGDDVSRPDKVISELKHYTAYGVPVGGLNCAVAALGRHEVFEYCQPVFEAAVKDAGAYNVMCSYSSIDGQPLPSDHELLTDVLRGQWGMRGFVRSDMCAISMLNCDHNVADSREEAIRMALEAGTDVQLHDFPHDFYQSTIVDYVKRGLLPLETLDRAVSRVLRTKFDLGLFDDPYVDETLQDKVLHCKEHKDLAYKIASKSITLLKNENKLLPLKKGMKKIAVLGPSANILNFGDYSVSDETYDKITLYSSIKEIVGDKTEVVYAKGCDFKELTLKRIPNDWYVELKGEYFNNSIEPTGEPVLIRDDRAIDFSFIAEKAAGNVDAQFSARWTGVIESKIDEDAFIGFNCRDSIKLWVDDKLVVDAWGDRRGTDVLAPFKFEKKRYNIKIEYRNDERGAAVILGWRGKPADINEALEAVKGADVAILSLGDKDQITTGENFDRCDLNLPGKQLDFLKAVYATGTPIVLVLQSGRPMTLTWENEHIPAIVQAFFAGELGGKAIADVLFGNVNPSGKLSCSFPKTLGQIPVHYSRKPAGGKRYVEGFDRSPLFPFGYGLSYTTFRYSDLKLSSDAIKPDETLKVSFKITNTGDVAGEEVCQVYIKDYFASVVKPGMELKECERIHLEPGETKTVEKELGTLAFRTLNPKYQWVVEPGQMRVMIGGSSADLPLQSDFWIVK